MFQLQSCKIDLNNKISNVTLLFPFNNDSIFVEFDYRLFANNVEEYASYFNYNLSNYRIEIERIFNKVDKDKTKSNDLIIEYDSPNVASTLFKNNKTKKTNLLLTEFTFSINDWSENKIADFNIDDQYSLRIYLLPEKHIPSHSHAILKIINKKHTAYLSLKDNNGETELENILLPINLSEELSEYKIYLCYFDSGWSFIWNSKDCSEPCSYGLIFPKRLLYKLFSKQIIRFTFDNLSEIEALLSFEKYYDPILFDSYFYSAYHDSYSDFDEHILKIKLSILRDSYYCSYIHDIDDLYCLIYFDAYNKGIYTSLLTEDYIKSKITDTNKYVFKNIHKNQAYDNNFIKELISNNYNYNDNHDDNYERNDDYDSNIIEKNQFWNSLDNHDKLALDSERFMADADKIADEENERNIEALENYYQFMRYYGDEKRILGENKPLLFSNSRTIYQPNGENYSEYVIKQYKFILPNYLTKSDKSINDYKTSMYENYGKHLKNSEVAEMKFEIEAPQIIDITFFTHYVKENIKYKIAKHNNILVFKIDNKNYCENIKRLFNVNLFPVSYLNNPNKDCFYYCIINNNISSEDIFL